MADLKGGLSQPVSSSKFGIGHLKRLLPVGGRSGAGRSWDQELEELGGHVQGDVQAEANREGLEKGADPLGGAEPHRPWEGSQVSVTLSTGPA